MKQLIFFIILIIGILAVLYFKSPDRQPINSSTIAPIIPILPNSLVINIPKVNTPVCPLTFNLPKVEPFNLPKIEPAKPHLSNIVKEPEYHCNICNLTEKALFIWVNDVRYVLVPEQSVIVAVQKQFLWKIEGRQLEKDFITDGAKNKTILIRH